MKKIDGTSKKPQKLWTLANKVTVSSCHYPSFPQYPSSYTLPHSSLLSASTIAHQYPTHLPQLSPLLSQCYAKALPIYFPFHPRQLPPYHPRPSFFLSTTLPGLQVRPMLPSHISEAAVPHNGSFHGRRSVGASPTPLAFP